MELVDHLASSLDGASLRFVTGFRHRLAAGFSCSLHQHAGLEVIYHPSGSGAAGLGDGSSLPITPGCALIHAPRAVHDEHLDTAGEDWCVQVTWPAWPSALFGRTWLVPRVTDPALLIDLERLTLRSTRGTAADHRATALVLGLLAATGAEVDAGAVPDAAAALAERAAREIRERYAELEGIAALACELGVGPDHLRHCFTAHHGVSPVAYLGARRIERAKELLRYTLIPVAEVATQCGYGSARYFSSAFRRAAGCAPSEYRTRRGPEVQVL